MSERSPSLYQHAKLAANHGTPEPIMLAFDFGSTVDVDRFRTAVNDQIARHHALRSRFRDTGSGWRVQVADPTEAAIDLDRSRVGDPAEALAQVTAAVSNRVDPRGGAVVAAGVTRIGLFAPRDVCWLAVDHVVIDGRSVELLASGVRAGYAGSPLPVNPDAIEYYDFGEAHTRWVRDNLRRIAAECALTAPAGSPYPRLLPAYLAPPDDRDDGAARADLPVPTAAVAGLEAAARRYGMSPFAAHASAFATAYLRVAGETNGDVPFLTPVGYRAWPGTDSVVGYFVTLAPVRAQVGSWGEHRWKAAVGIDAMTAAERAVVPFHLLASVLARHAAGDDSDVDDPTRLQPAFPTWPTVIFDVQRGRSLVSSFDADPVAEAGTADDIAVRRLGGRLVGPTLLATATAPEHGASKLSVTFSGEVYTPMVRQLLRAWYDVLAGDA